MKSKFGPGCACCDPCPCCIEEIPTWSVGLDFTDGAPDEDWPCECAVLDGTYVLSRDTFLNVCGETSNACTGGFGCGDPVVTLPSPWDADGDWETAGGAVICQWCYSNCIELGCDLPDPDPGPSWWLDWYIEISLTLIRKDDDFGDPHAWLALWVQLKGARIIDETCVLHGSTGSYWFRKAWDLGICPATGPVQCSPTDAGPFELPRELAYDCPCLNLQFCGQLGPTLSGTLAYTDVPC